MRNFNHWETLCPEADEEIEKISNNWIADRETEKAFFLFSLVQYKHKDADVCKETVNNFIEFFVNAGEDEESIVEIYHKINDLTSISLWVWEYLYEHKHGSFEEFWSEYGYDEDYMKDSAKNVWDEILNNDTLWANSFADYWMHKNNLQHIS
jgi:hypothetical protein